MKNMTDLPDSQVELILMRPSRDRVIGEQTVGVSVGAGENAEVPFSYAFPANAELGIYHLDYELLDGAGVTIQPVAEEDTGRIVVAQPPTASPYRPSDLQLSTVLPGGETFLINQPATFRYRLVNRAPTARHLRLRWDISHGPSTLAAEFDLAANSAIESDLPITVTYEEAGQLNLWLFEDGGGPPSQSGWGRPGDPGNFRVQDAHPTEPGDAPGRRRGERLDRRRGRVRRGLPQQDVGYTRRGLRNDFHNLRETL